jgi:hypothetical protein
MPTSSPTATRPFISVVIIFDDNPWQTSWRLEALLNEDELLIEVRYPGDYASYTAGNQVIEQVNLLTPRSSPTLYRFTMTDNENDGLCCTAGNGVLESIWGILKVVSFSLNSKNFTLKMSVLSTTGRENQSRAYLLVPESQI